VNTSGRGLWVAVGVAGVLIVGTLAVAALRGPGGCTDVGGASSIRFSIPTESRPALGTIRVTLKQKGRSSFVEFPPDPTNKAGSYIERGVYLDGDSYSIAMTDDVNRGPLDAEWDGGLEATLLIDGLGINAKRVFRHEETFRFDTHFPNGKRCDGGPYLSHTTAVDKADLVSSD
jgi:hypothetical protein